MTSQRKIEVRGGFLVGPVSALCSPFAGGVCPTPIDAEQLVEISTEITRPINSPAAWVDLLAGTGIAGVRALLLSVSGGTLEVRVSSAYGTDQILPNSQLHISFLPLVGSELTALSVRGVANLTARIGGDAA